MIFWWFGPLQNQNVSKNTFTWKRSAASDAPRRGSEHPLGPRAAPQSSISCGRRRAESGRVGLGHQYFQGLNPLGAGRHFLAYLHARDWKYFFDYTTVKRQCSKILANFRAMSICSWWIHTSSKKRDVVESEKHSAKMSANNTSDSVKSGQFTTLNIISYKMMSIPDIRSPFHIRLPHRPKAK